MQAVLTSFGIQGMPHDTQGLTWEAAQRTAVYKWQGCQQVIMRPQKGH